MRKREGRIALFRVNHHVHDEFKTAVLRYVPRHLELRFYIHSKAPNTNTQGVRSAEPVERIPLTSARCFDLRVLCGLHNFEPRIESQFQHAVASSEPFQRFIDRLAECKQAEELVLHFCVRPS